MTDMTAETPVDAEYLTKWYKIQQRMAKDKATEAMMRSRIAKHYFPAPTEGSRDNKHPLNDGTGAVLQMDHKINRKVLEPELAAYKEAMREEGSNLPKLPLNKLVKYVPELVTSEYRKLTAEERRAFDTVLNIREGSPQMEIVIPKRAAA